jgi:lipopolysaccharide export system ATP-binding protein
MSEAAPGPVALEARDVTVVTRGGRKLLRGISLELHAGEVLGVLGPSGAGKSTLFRTLVGELLPTAGEVRLEGRVVTQWPLWRRARAGVGWVPQGPSTLLDLTLLENFEVFYAVAGVGPSDRAARRRAIEQDAARFGLAQRLGVRAGLLSAGERRRLEVARALVHRPRVLVCDEPFAGVEPSASASMAELLADLAHTHQVGVVLADHHVAEALPVCSRALLLLDGAIQVDADPISFRKHPLVEGRYLGTWHRSMPPPKPAT